MIFGLAQISRRYDSELVHSTRIWYRKPQGEYSDRQFNTLFSFVRDEFLRLDIAALVIDNASLLDVTTVQRILDVRRLLGHRLALIFCTRIEREGTINASLANVLDVTLNNREQTAAGSIDEVEQSIELKPTSEAETRGAVLKQLLSALNIDFAPDLNTRDIAATRAMFWSQTLGTWDMIAKLERRLRDLVGSSKGRRRFLTRELIERWLGVPLPVKVEDT